MEWKQNRGRAEGEKRERSANSAKDRGCSIFLSIEKFKAALQIKWHFLGENNQSFFHLNCINEQMCFFVFHGKWILNLSKCDKQNGNELTQRKKRLQNRNCIHDRVMMCGGATMVADVEANGIQMKCCIIDSNAKAFTTPIFTAKLIEQQRAATTTNQKHFHSNFWWNCLLNYVQCSMCSRWM